MPMSHYLDELTLKAVFNAGAFPSFTNLYASLFTSTPGKGGGGTEVSGFGYARVAIAATGALWGVTGPLWISRNAATINFGAAAGGDWGLITAVGLHDAATSGNLLFFDPVNTAKYVSDGDPVVINAGNLQVSGSF